MSQRIFTNGEEGKILAAIGNRIVKQPYEFGKAFQNRMGLDNYIKVDGLSLPMVFDCLSWSINIGVGPYCMIKGTGDHNYTLTCVTSANNNLYFNNNTTTQFNSGNFIQTAAYSVSSRQSMTYISLSESIRYLQQLGGNGVRYSQLTTITPPSNLIGLYVGAWAGQNVALPSSYANASTKFGRFVVFNRILGDAERIYFYNNNLGNELQSTTGIVVDWRMDFAEVINISGVDQPCVRDYSGNNRHGIIMNLPAGTAQQKVDYANANLFVTFLT